MSNKKQLQEATKSMIDWLSHPNELGHPPYEIICTHEFDRNDEHFLFSSTQKTSTGNGSLEYVEDMNLRKHPHIAVLSSAISKNTRKKQPSVMLSKWLKLLKTIGKEKMRIGRQMNGYSRTRLRQLFLQPEVLPIKKRPL